MNMEYLAFKKYGYLTTKQLEDILYNNSSDYWTRKKIKEVIKKSLSQNKWIDPYYKKRKVRSVLVALIKEYCNINLTT